MMMRTCVFFLLGGCGRDSGFTTLKTPEPPAEDTSAPPTETVEETVPEEQPECPERIYSAQVAPIDEDCKVEPPTWRYTPVVEWKMDEFAEDPDFFRSMATPVVGHFTDDDGDGSLGSPGDIPDIAGLYFDGVRDICGGGATRGVLRLISGDGSQVHWSRSEYVLDDGTWWISPYMYPALGDVDADGQPEIIATLYQGRGDYSGRLVALDGNGDVEWVGEESFWSTQSRWNAAAPSAHVGIWDLDQDGVPEVLAGDRVYSGLDGAVVLPELQHLGSSPVVTDLEGDGVLEIVTVEGIFENDGTLRCTLPLYTGIGYVAVADVDGDGLGNPVLTGDGFVTILDEQCQMLTWEYLWDGGRGGAATIADYDGDGLPEVGLSSASQYFVFDGDGTLLWTRPVSDRSSNETASSVYDFEGDGYAEVVYAGEQNLWVFSGHDGTPRMVEASQQSCTLYEYPITVDVDGDDQVEIVVQDANGIRVVGDADNGWVPARQVWNQYAYSITNVNDDLSIPAYNAPNWPEYNSFRSADIRVNNGQGALLVDAVPTLVDICELECGGGTVQVVFQGANQGLADATDGVALALYAEQEDGSRQLLQVIEPETLLRAGYTTEGYAVVLDMADLPTATLVIAADDDGTGTGAIDECDETNNELVLEGLCSDD